MCAARRHRTVSLPQPQPQPHRSRSRSRRTSTNTQNTNTSCFICTRRRTHTIRAQCAPAANCCASARSLAPFACLWSAVVVFLLPLPLLLRYAREKSPLKNLLSNRQWWQQQQQQTGMTHANYAAAAVAPIGLRSPASGARPGRDQKAITSSATCEHTSGQNVSRN